MAKFLSGRTPQLNVGVSSSTENKTVLQITGKVGIGTTNADNRSLYVIGDTEITGVTTLASMGGITTTGGDLYVGGNFHIRDDVDFSVRNAYFTGVGTITTLKSSVGFITSLSGSHLNYTGISTITNISNTNLSSGVGTITTLVSSSSSLTNLYSSGISTLTTVGINSNLFVSGITTLGVVTSTNITGQNLVVSGVTTLGVTSTTSLTSQKLTVSGASTIFTNTSDTSLRIVQEGTGNILVVEDSSSSDLTPFIINNDGNVGIGTTNPTSKLYVSGDTYVTGVVTATTFFGALTGIAASATQLVTPRTFEITGDIVASPISFDGTGNVSLAATIQPNSVALGTDTTGDYVQSISGTSNQITITSGTGEGSTPVVAITTNPTLPGNVTVENNLIVDTNTLVVNSITDRVGIGTTNPTSKLYVSGDTYVTGVVTATTFFGALTGIAASATQLVTPRTFEITGDVVASVVSFDGTGNVSLAATIQPNSVALGTDTTGDYVQSISGTSNQITVTSGSGESSTPTLSIPSQFTAPQDVTVTRDLQVNRNLNVNGNITIGGTSVTLFATELKVADPDIVLGIRTDSNNNDVSTDNTANHGGIAVASTEGNPLVQLYNPGIGESTPATYKKIMWFKAGSFAGLNTDAWLVNYAIGIGSTQVPNGVRLAVGGVQITDTNIKAVTGNYSGIVTATTFVGALTGIAASATQLVTPRTFEITGDVVASAISFDGTGNVSLAATIQPNSVALGTDTTGDYVQSISGTSNQITISSGTGEGSTPVIAISANPTLPGNVTVQNDLIVDTSTLVINSTTDSVGIGTTNPLEKLQVIGNILFNNTTSQGSVTAIGTTTIAIGIHSGLSTSTYRSIEYTIQATQGSNYHATKILTLHDGTNTYQSEYGTIYNNGLVATYDTDISGGNIRLLASGISTLTTNYIVNFIATKI